ncbi:MAG: hypothetical protein QM504_15320 [Pseudomonadota bacterium]
MLTHSESVAIFMEFYEEVVALKIKNFDKANVAMLIIGNSKGHVPRYGYSTNSALSFEQEFALDVIPTTHSTSQFAQQTNDQSLNHTEPKLLQDFEDEFDFDNASYIHLHTIRDVCGSCSKSSVTPFKTACKKTNTTFYLYEYGGNVPSMINCKQTALNA